MLHLLQPSALGSCATCLATSRSDGFQGKQEGASGTNAASELHLAPTAHCTQHLAPALQVNCSWDPEGT